MGSFENSFSILLVFLTIFVFRSQAADSDDRPLRRIWFQAASPAHAAKCLEDNQLTRDQLLAAVRDQSKDLPKNVLCHIKCVAELNGAITKDGNVVSDFFKKRAPPSLDAKVLDTIMKCFEGVGKVTTCEDMAKLAKCVPKP